MMATENSSSPLTQPVKNIAEWTFPLSEILERYLREQNRINFTEAALVLQKSTSAYVVRLEDLYTQITLLQKPMEETEHEKSQGHCAKKSVVVHNLENLHLVDMQTRLGRNIDIKDDESDGKETVKLLSRRFPELENYDITHSQPPIYIYDVCREVIGKKYDFRCTHPMDIYGTLIDELIPDEPDSMLDALVKERRNSSLLAVEVYTPGTVSSGYGSSTSMSESQETPSSSVAQDLDTNIASFAHMDNDYLSDDYILQETFEESLTISNDDASFEQESENINADKEIEFTPTRRSDRVKNLHRISKMTKNAMTIRNACCKSLTPIQIRRSSVKAPRRARKRKHREGHNELNACIQSMEESLKSGLAFEAVEDDRSNLLGFTVCDSAEKEVEPDTSDFSRSPTPLDVESPAGSMSPDPFTDCDQPDISCTVPDNQSEIDDTIHEIAQENNVTTECENSVTEWHRSLEPKLLEAEKRAAFDLQGYESEIVSNLKASGGNKVDFDEVARDKSVHEISRYFLASLHLASANNIEISSKEGLGMELTLINDQTN